MMHLIFTDGSGQTSEYINRSPDGLTSIIPDDVATSLAHARLDARDGWGAPLTHHMEAFVGYVVGYGGPPDVGRITRFMERRLTRELLGDAMSCTDTYDGGHVVICPDGSEAVVCIRRDGE